MNKGDRIGIRNYDGSVWYAMIEEVIGKGRYRVGGIGKSKGVHMDIEEGEICSVLVEEDGAMVYKSI